MIAYFFCKRFYQTVAVSSSALFTFAAGAALLPRLMHEGIADAYYDTALNITFLADANFAKTSHAATALADGRFQTWYDATNWVKSINVDGFDGWRLPNSDPSCHFPDYGSCDRLKSEYHYLFLADLGGTYGYNIATSHNDNYALFRNIQGGWAYWSSTEFVPGWAFLWSTASTQPATAPKVPIYPVGAPYFAWPVRNGDIPIKLIEVSEPVELGLFGISLVSLALLRRKGLRIPAI